jgi:hypothetical protein
MFVISALDGFRSSANKIKAATAKGFRLQHKQFDFIFTLQFLGATSRRLTQPQ